MAKISQRHIKAWQKFNDELDAFRKETDSELATLYEDAFTTREVKDFQMTESGSLTWVEDGKAQQECMYDEDDAREWLKFWKACLRRAKRYWAMDSDRLDAIQDGLEEDNDED